MFLSQDDVVKFNKIITTALACDIESIIIDDHGFRGLSANHTVAVFSQSEDVVKLPQKIGLTRLGQLKARMELLGQAPKIEVKESTRGEIGSIEISSGRSKVQFRCAGTGTITAPKRLSDPSKFLVVATKSELKQVFDSIRVMSSKSVHLVLSRDGKVAFEVQDEAGETFHIDLETPYGMMDDGAETESIVHSYEASVFASVLKLAPAEADAVPIGVGAGGSIITAIYTHPIFILPKKGTDGDYDNDD